MNMDQLDPLTLDPNAVSFDPPKRRGWWSRNWLWFVPTVLLAFVIFCCGCPLGIIAWFYSYATNLQPFVESVAKIEADEGLQNELGKPIVMVDWPPPSIRIEDRDADIRWEIEGPKGRAKAHMLARKMGERWEIVVLEVVLANGKKISLAGDGGNDAPPFEDFKPQADKPEQEAPAPTIQMAVPQADS